MNERPDSLEALDRQFAALLQRLAGASSEPLALAARLVSRATRAGHVCIHLQHPPHFDSDDEPTAAAPPSPPDSLTWQAALRASPVVGSPGEFKPLILDPAGRLYLQRYWHYETQITRAIEDRLLAPPTPVPPELIDRYFGPETPNAPDWQRRAVATALTRRFSVISGGPGTGKTYTVAVLVAALLESAGPQPPRLALAAPTGKAAIRLQEAVLAARNRLPCPPDLRARLPATAVTVHRLLGAIPGQTHFRHHAGNPLPFDGIIIDEASMVDLALMAKLLDACRPDARVVLVGDMNQLASVEAGAVLGDICDGVRGEAAPAPAAPGPRSALADCIVPLRKNHRFKDGTGIAALSTALNAGDAPEALRLLDSGDAALAVRRLGRAGDHGAGNVPERLARQLAEPIERLFTAVRTAPTPAEALPALGEFRILCALRRGPFGTEALNLAIERRLRDRGHITAPTPFYPGRPILVLQNDYNLRLFNGDVGLVLPHPETRELRVWFLDTEGRIRDFAPGRLPSHETVFAMTVHKSQGSEFQEVLMLLPDRDSPVLTRELIYTGVTRARRRVELWLEEDSFRRALSRRTARTSGLADRLWRRPE